MNRDFLQRKWFRVSSVLTCAVLLVVLWGCNSNQATSAASCGWLVGNGQNGADANIHKIIYPGQQFYKGDNENALFVPCNSRNYIITDGTSKYVSKDANGVALGDRTTPVFAYTKSGQRVKIQVRADWTLNQDQQAMKDFYNICFKYTCASDSDHAGDVNFSTDGWNGMLRENMGPAMDLAANAGIGTMDDAIWQTHSIVLYRELAKKMADDFPTEIFANFGYSENIFCGSGNSKWVDPTKPGEGQFICSPVRFTVTDVQADNSDTGTGSSSQTSLNQQRLANAKALYGDQASYWLGIQDSIAQCKAAGVNCVFNIGGSNNVPVSVPAAQATPTPTATPTPAAVSNADTRKS